MGSFDYASMSREYVDVAEAVLDTMSVNDKDASISAATRNLTAKDLEWIGRVEINPSHHPWWELPESIPGLQNITHGHRTLVLELQDGTSTSSTTIAKTNETPDIVMEGTLAQIPHSNIPIVLISWCKSVCTKAKILKHAKDELRAQEGMTCLSAFGTVILCTTDEHWLASLQAACHGAGYERVLRTGEHGKSKRHLLTLAMVENRWVQSFVESFGTAIQFRSESADGRAAKVMFETDRSNKAKLGGVT
jgi:hypothetical protein